MMVMSIRSLQIKLLGFLTRKSLTHRLLEIWRKVVTREESLQKFPAARFFRRHLLSAPIREKMLGWMEVLHTEGSSSGLCSPATGIPTHTLSPPLPCSAPVPGLLKRDCKHQGISLLMRSSTTAAGKPCRNMCGAQGSRQQQYPALLPSLPSSTCN